MREFRTGALLIGSAVPAGFVPIAGWAVHDKTANDRAFMKLPPLIEQAATDAIRGLDADRVT